MILLFLLVLSAFAMKPTLSLDTSGAGITQPYGNTMMYDIPIAYTGTMVAGHDHEVYVAIGTNGSAAMSCAAVNGTPDSPGANWTYGKFKVAGATAGTLHFIVYNMVPGTPYYFKAAVGNINAASPTWNVTCNGGTTIGTPTLPAGLADLNLSVTNPSTGTIRSKYVLFDTDDCSATGESHMGAKNMLVAVDTRAGATFGKIVWYLDIDAVTTASSTTKLTGWHYQKGSGMQGGHILGVVEHGYVYDWKFDGTTASGTYTIDAANAISDPGVNHCDGTGGMTPDEGPCVSHDAVLSDGGNTYAITTYDDDHIGVTGTGWASSGGADCGSGSGSYFSQDGYSKWNGGTFSSEVSLIDDYPSDYDPTAVVAPNDGMGDCSGGYWDGDLYNNTVDYTHANSISVYRPSTTDWVDLSLLNWNQIIRFDGGTGTLEWTLSDCGTGGVCSATSGPSDLSFSIAGGLTGAASFTGQHDAHIEGADNLVMFDNGGARALNITLTGGSEDTRTAAQITKSWRAVDPTSPGNALTCQAQGSAEFVPGMAASMLLDCNDAKTIEEFTNANGNGALNHSPALAITLPGSPTELTTADDDACAGNGPDAVSFIHGWYRAYPISNVGEY
jgi:hypothetical protein